MINWERLFLYEYDTEISAVENIKDSFDGAGGIEHAVSDWVIRDNIDEEEIKDYFRDGEYDNVRDNLESYFDEDDFEYSEDVQNRMDEIEGKLENPEGLSQEELDELNEELEDLRDSDKDIPEHMIDDKVEELLNDLVSDPIDTIKNYGLDISNFIDEDAVAKQVVRDDGYGNSVEFEDDTYYIFELDE